MYNHVPALAGCHLFPFPPHLHHHGHQHPHFLEKKERECDDKVKELHCKHSQLKKVQNNLACVAGAKRGRGRGEGEPPSPFSLPPYPLSPIPYPFRCLLSRLKTICSILLILPTSVYILSWSWISPFCLCIKFKCMTELGCKRVPSGPLDTTPPPSPPPNPYMYLAHSGSYSDPRLCFTLPTCRFSHY